LEAIILCGGSGWRLKPDAWIPREPYEYADKGAAILLAKPNLPFGRVQMQNTYVTRFEQKPQLDFYVSAGHYVFKTSVIKHYFPEEGDMELSNSPNPCGKTHAQGIPI